MAQITPNFFQNNQSYVKIDSECFSGESNQDIPYPPSQGPSKASKHSQNLPTACGKLLNSERAHLDPVFTRCLGVNPEKHQKVQKTTTQPSTNTNQPTRGYHFMHYDMHPGDPSLKMNMNLNVVEPLSRGTIPRGMPRGIVPEKPQCQRLNSTTPSDYPEMYQNDYKKNTQGSNDFHNGELLEYKKTARWQLNARNAGTDGFVENSGLEVPTVGSGVGEANGVLGETFVKSGPFVPYFSTSPGQGTPPSSGASRGPGGRGGSSRRVDDSMRKTTKSGGLTKKRTSRAPSPPCSISMVLGTSANPLNFNHFDDYFTQDFQQSAKFGVQNDAFGAGLSNKRRNKSSPPGCHSPPLPLPNPPQARKFPWVLSPFGSELNLINSLAKGGRNRRTCSGVRSRTILFPPRDCGRKKPPLRVRRRLPTA